MITINKETKYQLNYDLNSLFPDKKICFFDIETTGLSKSRSMIYLIGLCYFENNTCHSTLYFNEDAASETQLIKCLNDYIKDFDILITFNGDSFDIPFVIGRAEMTETEITFDNIQSFDIFKFIKKFKHLFRLDNYKQKTIELFLGIERDDKYDGGKLIEVYKKYVLSQSDTLYDLLILHNFEDILGMVKLCEIFTYIDAFTGRVDFIGYRILDDKLILEYKLQNIAIKDISLKLDYFYLSFSKDKLILSIDIFEGELKHFYEDYKNYYYLPLEDMAIHKSVAEFVDKEHRKKATKDNCYTKKSGRFCIQAGEIFSPIYKNNYKDKYSFFEIDSIKTNAPDKNLFNNYYTELLKL